MFNIYFQTLALFPSNQKKKTYFPILLIGICLISFLCIENIHRYVKINHLWKKSKYFFREVEKYEIKN